MKILIIHGPNLSLLGKREPIIYGNDSIEDINHFINDRAKNLDKNIKLSFFQSDIEGEIIQKIGKSWTNENINGIIINPGAYTHTSIGIHDAIKASGLKCIEVHLSNIYKRENFRHTSIISSACDGQISGFGKNSYILALNAIYDLINKK